MPTFTFKFYRMHKMPIFSYGYLYSQAKSHCLHGMPTFTLGTPILMLNGQISMFAWGAHFTAGCPYLL